MDSSEKSDRLTFGVTSFPSSAPLQDNNQSEFRQPIRFTFPPTQASGGFSQWASSSAGLLNASASGNHAQDISVKKDPTTSDSNMELDVAETAPSTGTAGTLAAPAVAVWGDQVQGGSRLALRPISSDQNVMSGEVSIVPVAADATRACVVFESVKDREMCLPLASVDISTLSSDKSYTTAGCWQPRLFYFQNFRVSSSKRGTWKCKLTLYGHTFECDYIFHTPLEAKRAMARKALEKLRSIYSTWTVPPEPMDSPLATGWSWTEILKDYCIQNGLPEPTYTKYNHQQGCRHEAEVANFSRFGVLKHYTQVELKEFRCSDDLVRASDLWATLVGWHQRSRHATKFRRGPISYGPQRNSQGSYEQRKRQFKVPPEKALGGPWQQRPSQKARA